MTNEPTQPEKVELGTPDLAAANRAAFDRQFPGVLADGVIDTERLKELLDVEAVSPADERERYGLMWAGKKEAVRSLQTPSRGTLIPDFDASVDWDTAKNVFIEGDNLEVLKLLQKAYNDQVKLIYIDPPYNTGNDFVYNDDFSDGLRGYLHYTGQIDDDGNRTSSDEDRAGRRHSRWLSMMYPRLTLARNLLTQDGVLLCSINDVEFANLFALLTEVFGEENFLATFIWNNDGNIEQQSRIKVNHEYIVAFARNEPLVGRPTVIDPNILETSKLFNETIENSITKNGPANPPSTVELPVGFPASAEEFTVEPRSDGFPEIIDRIVVKDGALTSPAKLRSGWSSRRLLDLFIGNGLVPIEDAEGKLSRFAVTRSGAIYLYKERSASQGHVLTVLKNMGTTKASSTRLAKEWGIHFDFPKPERLLQHLVATFTSGNDLVLDFFAGSGSTAHAVALQNEADKAERRVVSVNIPEPVGPSSRANSVVVKTVSDVTLSRISQVVQKVPGARKLGLRVERLSMSSFRDSSTSDDNDLFDLRESTLDDPEPVMEHIAQEVLLREGVRLDSIWNRHKAAGAPVVVADGVAVVMSLALTQEIAEAALALEPKVVVFLEDGFAGADAVKANTFTNAKNSNIVMKTV